MTQAEDELVFASRLYGRKKGASSTVSSVSKESFEGNSIRDTIGLKSREGTHANVGV